MLSQDRNTTRREGNVLVAPVAPGMQIFAGALVAIDPQGFAVPAAPVEGLKAAGRAEEHIDNRLGAPGEQNIKIRRGEFAYRNSTTNPVTQADLLGECYIEDDETVRAFDNGADAVNVRAGLVTGVEGDIVWVEVL